MGIGDGFVYVDLGQGDMQTLIWIIILPLTIIRLQMEWQFKCVLLIFYLKLAVLEVKEEQLGNLF